MFGESGDLVVWIALAIAFIVGWVSKGRDVKRWTRQPAIAIMFLAPAETRELTPNLAPSIARAVGHLRQAQQELGLVTGGIHSATSWFANPSFDKRGSTGLDTALSEALGDISHAIGTLANESELTPYEREQVERRYAVQQTWFERFQSGR
jgi:hypothetical protein